MTEGKRRSFGQVRKLPSGRYQARFRREGEWHTAKAADGGPRTFTTRKQAERWLDRTEEDIAAGVWQPHAKPVKVEKFAGYAEDWLATHRTPKGEELKPRTHAHYRRLLDKHLIPAFGEHRVDRITPEMVDRFYISMSDTPTQQAHAYALMKQIMGRAVKRKVIAENPCDVDGGGSVDRDEDNFEVLSVAEINALADAMPQQHRLMVLLAAWTGLRFGELTELRRDDIDVTKGKVTVSRGVTWHKSTGFKVGPTKGNRSRKVSIPPHLMDPVKAHLRDMPINGDALLFPSRRNGHLQASTVFKVFKPAARAIGRPDLRFHDLRHTAAVLARLAGASGPDLMFRLGHATSAMSDRYQHFVEDQDRKVAEALSRLAEGTVTEIRKEAATE